MPSTSPLTSFNTRFMSAPCATSTETEQRPSEAVLVIRSILLVLCKASSILKHTACSASSGEAPKYGTEI